MSKVNTIIGNYFKYGGLTSEPSFSKLLIYSQYSTHYSHKMTQLQKINYITKRENTLIVNLKYIGLGKTTNWLP